MSYAGRTPDRSEILELARAMARMEGLSYADELKDDAPSLALYVSRAKSILSGRHALETTIWEAMEPFLEGPIQLDLNDPGDNLAFGHMVSQIASAVLKAQEEELDPNPRTAGVANDSAESLEEIEYDYADADVNGHVMTNLNESMAYLGATTRMRRRKSGPWEPVPQDGDS